MALPARPQPNVLEPIYAATFGTMRLLQRLKLPPSMSKGRRPRPRGWRQRKYEKPPRGTMAPSTYGSLSRCHMGSPSPWPRVSKQSGQASQSALHRCRALPALAKYPTRRVRPMPNAPAPHRWRRAQANGAIHRICPARPRSGRQCANGPQGPAQAPLRS